MDSRIQEIKLLRNNLESLLKWHAKPSQMEDLIINAADLIIEIENNPLERADMKKYRAEQFLANETARFLLEHFPYILNKKDKLESVYKTVDDPHALTKAVGFGFHTAYYNEEREDFEGIALRALNLGGILDFKAIESGSAFNNPSEINPKLLGKLIFNLLENSWAQSPEAYSDINYSIRFIGLIAVLAESDPAAAVKAVLTYPDIISKLGENLSSHYDTTIKSKGRNRNKSLEISAVIALSSALNSSKFYASLMSHLGGHDLYTELMHLPLMKDRIANKFMLNEEFNISNMPNHDIFIYDDSFLLGLYADTCAIGMMSEKKSQDIQTLWANSFKKGKLTDLAVRDPIVQVSMKKYYELLNDFAPRFRTEYFGVEGIEFEHVQRFGHNYLFIDSLIKPIGERVSDSEERLDHHNALMIITRGKELTNSELDKMKITRLLVEAMMHSLSIKNNNKSIKRRLLAALVNPEENDAFSHLYLDKISKLKGFIPEITEEALRNINWNDNQVKSKLLDTALGL